MNFRFENVCVLYTMIQQYRVLTCDVCGLLHRSIYVYEKNIRNGGALRVGALYAVAEESNKS